MRIITKEIKIKKINNLTSQYIEEELANRDYNVLRWAIIGVEDNKLVVSASIFKEKFEETPQNKVSAAEVFKKALGIDEKTLE